MANVYSERTVRHTVYTGLDTTQDFNFQVTLFEQYGSLLSILIISTQKKRHSRNKMLSRVQHGSEL